MATSDGELLARWTGKLDRTIVSPLGFYQMIVEAITDSELPDISFSSIMRREGGWFSPGRIYLRIRYKKLFFDISAIIVGNSVIVSWWLHQDPPDVVDLLAEIPGLGFILERTVRANTYYAVDVIEHFQRTIHETILQVVDELSEANGLVYLPDEERQPIWEEIR